MFANLWFAGSFSSSAEHRRFRERNRKASQIGGAAWRQFCAKSAALCASRGQSVYQSVYVKCNACTYSLLQWEKVAAQPSDEVSTTAASCRNPSTACPVYLRLQNRSFCGYFHWNNEAQKSPTGQAFHLFVHQFVHVHRTDAVFRLLQSLFFSLQYKSPEYSFQYCVDASHCREAFSESHTKDAFLPVSYFYEAFARFGQAFYYMAAWLLLIHR